MASTNHSSSPSSPASSASFTTQPAASSPSQLPLVPPPPEFNKLEDGSISGPTWFHQEQQQQPMVPPPDEFTRLQSGDILVESFRKPNNIIKKKTRVDPSRATPRFSTSPGTNHTISPRQNKQKAFPYHLFGTGKIDKSKTLKGEGRVDINGLTETDRAKNNLKKKGPIFLQRYEALENKIAEMWADRASAISDGYTAKTLDKVAPKPPNLSVLQLYLKALNGEDL